MKQILNEFKQFAIKGNVLDLAVGVIIANAFSKITNSLVNDILMPPLGLLLGKVDFTNLYLNLGQKTYASLAEAQAAGAPTINYGIFINNILNFLLIAIAVFFLIHFINRIKSSKAELKATNKECPFCFSIIPLKAIRCPNCTSELKK